MAMRMMLILMVLVGMLPACSKQAATVKIDEPASELLMVSAVKLDLVDGQGMVKIEANREPKYNVFKLSDPDRVVIDLIDAELASGIEKSIAGKAGVKEVKVESMKDSLSSLVRVEVYLSSGMSYMTSIDGSQLNVSLLGSVESVAAETTESKELTASSAQADQMPAPQMAPLEAAPTPAPAPAPAPIEAAPSVIPTPIPVRAPGE